MRPAESVAAPDCHPNQGLNQGEWLQRRQVVTGRGGGGNRTRDGAFAELCLTTWLPRQIEELYSRQSYQIRQINKQQRHAPGKLKYQAMLSSCLLHPLQNVEVGGNENGDDGSYRNEGTQGGEA